VTDRNEKSSSARIERPGDAEAIGGAPKDGGERRVASGADSNCVVYIGATAHDTHTAMAATGSRRAIGWRSLVAVVVTILHPLMNVADHIEEPEKVALE